MLRILLLAISLGTAPALAFDLHKWADELGNRQMERWKKEKLETAIKGRDAKARLEAVEGLSYGDDDAVAAFAVALGDSDARVRQAAASQLWSAEKRALPYRAQLTRALDDPDVNVVAYAAGALQAQGVKEAELVVPRRRVLDSAEASVAARFLVSRNLVGHEPPQKIVAATLAYLEQNSRPFTGRAGDSARKNVELAEKSLERLVRVTRDRGLIEPLQRALEETRIANIPLLRTLGKFEPRPDGWTATLLKQLDHSDARVRHEALSQMRSVKDEREMAVWVPRAAAMLQDPDTSVRSQALWALGSARGLAAGEIDKVIAAAAEGSPVRRSAVQALGEIAEANQAIPAATRAQLVATAQPALEAAMQDPDKDTREEARSALGKVVGRSDAPRVAAAAVPTGNESAGMARLRARKVTFEPSSFFRALTEVDVDLVRAFLDAGMSPSASLAGMGPPIRVMLFASQGCAPGERPTRAETKAVVKMLLERGADVHAADANGNSAISEAAMKGCDRELIRMLLKAGARIDAKNASGLTPFEMGLWSGHDGLEELIAAGYRLPPDKAKAYLEGYKDRPAALAMIRKASAKK
jgi:HEAT repeat protein